MIPQLLTLLATLVVPVMAGHERVRADVARNVIDAPVEVPADTILRPALNQPPASIEIGLSADEDEPHVTLGMRRIRVSSSGLGRPRGEDRAAPFGDGFQYRTARGVRVRGRLRADAGIEERAQLGELLAGHVAEQLPVQRQTITPGRLDQSIFKAHQAALDNQGFAGIGKC